MEPTVGRIVHFECDEFTAKDINERCDKEGGNRVQVGDKLAALIVRVWTSGCCNLRVFIDGKFDVWVTSVMLGEGPRSWNWPSKV